MDVSIQRLERGFKLAEKQRDFPSQVFCALALGLAYLMLEQVSAAKPHLEKSLEIASQTGNVELEGCSHAALAEVNYRLNFLESAIFHACLGMYLLEQRQNNEWRQAANLAAILQGRLGTEAFQQVLQQWRSQLVTRIGVDGFDHLPRLLEQRSHS